MGEIIGLMGCFNFWFDNQWFIIVIENIYQKKILTYLQYPKKRVLLQSQIVMKEHKTIIYGNNY